MPAFVGAISWSEGDVNDHAVKGSLGGWTAAWFDYLLFPAFEDNTTVGNATVHGVIGGEAPSWGRAGECPVACNLGVTVAAEGAGDYGREHTIGGAAAASGGTGCNPVVGTLGGAVHSSDVVMYCTNFDTADS